MPEALDVSVYRDLIRRALAEDLGPGDLTTAAIVPESAETDGVLLAKAPLVVCGLPIAREVFEQCDSAVRFESAVEDGAFVTAGTVLGKVFGRASSMLAAERTALNVLQYLSGIATVTHRFVEAAGEHLTVLDTRKTAPGLRLLAKYAVRCGGGRNHRVGLFDGILIKDNHIRVAGGVAEAMRQVRAQGHRLPVEVEAQSLAQVDDALAASADIIMLDNLDDEATRLAIKRIAGRAKVELSGNMTVERVRRLADAGADFVSVGALTHSAPAADISLEIHL